MVQARPGGPIATQKGCKPFKVKNGDGGGRGEVGEMNKGRKIKACFLYTFPMFNPLRFKRARGDGLFVFGGREPGAGPRGKG